MIQWLIYEKFGVEYSVFYIPQLLKNMGFSYQKAKFVADHKEPEKGKLWKKIKEKEIHLHYFPTFDSLKSKVEEALLHFKDLKNEVLALFGFCNKLAEAWSKFNPNYFLCITR